MNRFITFNQLMISYYFIQSTVRLIFNFYGLPKNKVCGILNPCDWTWWIDVVLIKANKVIASWNILLLSAIIEKFINNLTNYIYSRHHYYSHCLFSTVLYLNHNHNLLYFKFQKKLAILITHAIVFISVMLRNLCAYFCFLSKQITCI